MNQPKKYPKKPPKNHQKSDKRIIVATNNIGKVREIREILKDFPCGIIPMSEIDAGFCVEEDGQTYVENALKKARAAVARTGNIVIADDSGLEVDALGGAPGLYSARFGGEQLSQTEKNQRLLRKLQGETERSARFRCVIVVAGPDGRWEQSEGICEGVIGIEERGHFGFGFDPIFILPEYGKTMAELEPEIKNRISHRAKALNALPEMIHRFLADV